MRWTRSSSDEARRDVRRRLIVGLSGLLGMFMVVLLASLLTGQARKQAADAQAQAEAQGNAPATNETGQGDSGNQPLVDLGVAPPIDDATKANAPAKPAAQVAAPPAARAAAGQDVVVPDLQPDPQLQAPARNR